jgi:hypothetical protein
MLFSACGATKKSIHFRYLKNNSSQASSLRLDGYYYSIDPGTRTRYFLYKNGRILYAHECSCSTNEQMITKESDFSNANFLNYIKDSSSIFWTNYLIEGPSISFERIFPWQSYPHYMLTGQIINDSAFVITKQTGVYNIENTEKISTAVNDTFHFKQFRPKPVTPFN